jgi:hypothetical protein
LQAPNPDQKRKKCEEEGEEGARLIFVFPCENQNTRKIPIPQRKRLMGRWKQKKTTMTIRRPEREARERNRPSFLQEKTRHFLEEKG